ncbi:MAG TPA: hypothetical protein VJ853_14995, partial [Thermoanaerobaculia bacterium]|nr:hypothetical protein [Thermoanaerobaculia bacterium]
MKRIAIVLISLQICVLSLFAADAPKQCSLCVGAVADISAPPATPIPLLLQLREADLATSGVDAFTPEQRSKLTVTIRYELATTDAMSDVESHTQKIIDWARLHGPFEAIGVVPQTSDIAVAGYAIKRLAVTAQGLNVATRIVLPPGLDLDKLFDTGAFTYIDALLVNAPDVAKTSAWIAQKDPSKKLWAIVDPQSPNTFFDLARALADGATRAYITQATAEDETALANFNQAFIGDWAFDSTATTQVLDAKGNSIIMPVLTFVRGEDLRTIIVPKGDASAAFIASLPSDRFTRPRRVDVAGDRDVADVGT